MVKLNLCDDSYAYILMKGTIKDTGHKVDAEEERADGRMKNVTFKNCKPFPDSIIEMNNTKGENSKDLYVVMLTYNLVEYIGNNSKSSVSLWLYDRHETNATTIDSLKFKVKTTENTPNNTNTKDAEITVPLKF